MTIESLKGIKVALVHDWLNGMRGGEKCLEVLCEMFPDADLYTLIHEKGTISKIIESMKIIWERLKIVCEPSCSLPLAAVIKNNIFFKGKKVGIIISGGNVDLKNLPF